MSSLLGLGILAKQERVERWEAKACLWSAKKRRDVFDYRGIVKLTETPDRGAAHVIVVIVRDPPQERGDDVLTRDTDPTERASRRLAHLRRRVIEQFGHGSRRLGGSKRAETGGCSGTDDEQPEAVWVLEFSDQLVDPALACELEDSVVLRGGLLTSHPNLSHRLKRRDASVRECSTMHPDAKASSGDRALNAEDDPNPLADQFRLLKSELLRRDPPRQ